MYTHMGSGASHANNNGQLQSVLVKAGHQLQTVAERRGLDDALKTGHYDLVLVDLMDVAQVEESLRAAPSPPLVVPVVYEGTKAENKLLKKQYPFLLETPDKNGRSLTAIDRALDAKAKRDRTALRRN
jgi:CheY-like chemotaxis protein